MYFLCFYLLVLVKSEFYNTEPPNLFEIVQPKTDDDINAKLDQQKTEIDGNSLLILKKKITEELSNDLNKIALKDKESK